MLEKILAPKPVVSTVPKKDLVIALPYLSKLSRQIRTKSNRIIKNKLPYSLTVLLALFTNVDVVAAMLLLMTKLSIILRSESVSTSEFLHSLGKQLIKMMILSSKNIFYSAITNLILKIFKFLLPTTTTLKLP